MELTRPTRSVAFLFVATAILPAADRPKLQLVGDAEVWQTRIRLTPAIPQTAGGDGRRDFNSARIRYRPPRLTLYLDEGEPEFRVPIDLATATYPQGRILLGFTASTGSGYENHDILGWKFNPGQSPDQTQVTSNLSPDTSGITFGLTSRRTTSNAAHPSPMPKPNACNSPTPGATSAGTSKTPTAAATAPKASRKPPPTPKFAKP